MYEKQKKKEEWAKVDVTARPQDDADAMAIDDVDCDRWTSDGAGVTVLRRSDGTIPGKN